MVGIISKPSTIEKLEILSADAKYDLACACSDDKTEHRQRGSGGKWIYPVTLPNGGKSILFKTLISNVCSNDCKYCPLRGNMDIRRCTLSPDQTAKVFMEYYNSRKVFGLFLTSSVPGSPDVAMERLLATAGILRKKHGFKGYIHLKIIPGASDAAIQQAVSLANAVSVNIETPGEANMEKLSAKKNYIRDIIEPIKLISRLTAPGSKFQKVKQTTQFIVGAAGESDAEIVQYMWGLYDRLSLHRVYFSAYQKGLGDEALPAEQMSIKSPSDTFTREHRLYQVDFLLRKYGFTGSEIVFDRNGQLSLEVDPKQSWAKAHPESFPVNINTASKFELLRIPGLGPITVNRILKIRRTNKITSLENVGKVGSRLRKPTKYITF